jgi:hypothetical protein
MNKISINQKQRLYVIPCGKGYSCLGWDVCQKWTEALHKELLKVYNNYKLTVLCNQKYRKGTYKAYERYEELVSLACSINYNTGYRFTYQLEPRLIGLENKRVEVTSKDGSKSRFWVGKSTGCIPIHLAIAKRTSIGGPAVCILDTDTIKVVGER